MLNSHSDVLRQALRRLTGSTREADAIHELAAPPRMLSPGAVLHAEDDDLDAISILLGGMAKAYCVLPDGAHQTIALHVAGDIVDVDVLVRGKAAAAVAAVSSIEVVQVAAAPLRSLAERRPAITWGLWRRSCQEKRLRQEWMVGLGRRTAVERTAHLLCELVARSSPDGPRAHGCELPLTQVELADVLGLSTVHVNRVLQQLRAEGLIELARGRLTLKDRAGLVELSGFDPSYIETGVAPAGEIQ